MSVVSTIKDRCKACYSCVRQCPVKAIKVKVGQSMVVPERCISCGSCIKACSQNAKEVVTFVPQVEDYLKEGGAIALLAPSFPASIYPLDPGDFFNLLQEAGFNEVHELTIGVELTMPRYREYLAGRKEPAIGSHCAAVVNLIEKHFPDLIQYLIPIDSALMATAKLLRHRNKNCRLIFIGPCIAKKEEVLNSPEGIIDAVLTFKELKELLKDMWETKDVVPAPSFEKSYLPSTFPLTGGLVKNVDPRGNIYREDEVAVVEGKEECVQFLQKLQEGYIKHRLIDMLFCKGGCIDGPEIASDLDVFNRQYQVYQYSRSRKKENLGRLPKLQLDRSFSNKYQPLLSPSEEDIVRVLRYTNKNKPEDELNCGACGYNSCRDKAVAVCQGLAEIEMCLPYLLEQSRGELEYYKKRLKMSDEIKDYLVGDSPYIQGLRQTAIKLGQNDATLLILGESGVGKEVLARAVHMVSPRSEKPFIAINCAALPEQLIESELFGYEEGAFTGARKGGKPGKLDQARGGSLLLDEIAELPLSTQAKLLRVLQERAFERVGGTTAIRLSARIIAATNQDLNRLIGEGKFRSDLFYRLNVISVTVPALLHRKEDIPPLADHFLRELAAENKSPVKLIASEALALFAAYEWPGNVRELKNVIERAFYTADGNIIQVQHLPDYIRQLNGGRKIVRLTPMKKAVRNLEKDLIIKALKETNNNKVDAASMLGMPRATFYLKLKEYNIH
ncbi:4Fe-4S dicluster domain-containing protein [Desulfotomaculum arcticum]|uniref:4Fe-4S dicluster domain-containing protein n=1 Tax=Desulfotruncus arcticus DSM 17038 TaxID=1121424 RepID=A0A1I2TX11_9FIRM|nr:4Fe-4S dicluster domain-containing protein [Desulfotomaculum arcticum] [Desulfotruncus arcticus DSM 17038]